MTDRPTPRGGHYRINMRLKPKRTAKQLTEQIDREMRVDESKRPDDAPPWTSCVRGPQHWLLLDEISMAALAEGIVLARVQRQARLATSYLQD